jgi:hypothetical protein
MTTAITFGLGALCGVVSLVLAYKFDQVFRRAYWFTDQRGMPDYEAPPPPPPQKGKIWYRLQVHELKPGEVYRDRLTGWPVRVRKAGTQPKEGQSHYVTARGELVNRVTGVREAVDILNDDLETDNITLAPQAMKQLEYALMEQRPITISP